MPFAARTLGMPDRGGRFDINDDPVVDIDQVAGGNRRRMLVRRGHRSIAPQDRAPRTSPLYSSTQRRSVRTAIAVPMANDPPFATLNHVAGDLGIPSESALLRVGIIHSLSRRDHAAQACF
jgi:hypothetical protein